MEPSGPSGPSEQSEHELGLDMVLKQGDIQLVSHHLIMHARTSFVDYTDIEIENINNINNNTNTNTDKSDPATGTVGRRNLLRLWVTSENHDTSWDLYLSECMDVINVLYSMFEARIKYV